MPHGIVAAPAIVGANRGPVFGWRTPLQAMIQDGVPGLMGIRREVDALRGGH